MRRRMTRGPAPEESPREKEEGDKAPGPDQTEWPPAQLRSLLHQSLERRHVAGGGLEDLALDHRLNVAHRNLLAEEPGLLGLVLVQAPAHHLRCQQLRHRSDQQIAPGKDPLDRRDIEDEIDTHSRAPRASGGFVAVAALRGIDEDPQAKLAVVVDRSVERCHDLLDALGKIEAILDCHRLLFGSRIVAHRIVDNLDVLLGDRERAGNKLADRRRLPGRKP